MRNKFGWGRFGVVDQNLLRFKFLKKTLCFVDQTWEEVEETLFPLTIPKVLYNTEAKKNIILIKTRPCLANRDLFLVLTSLYVCEM